MTRGTLGVGVAAVIAVALVSCGGDGEGRTLKLLMLVDAKTSFTTDVGNEGGSPGDRWGFAGWNLVQDNQQSMGTAFGLCTDIASGSEPVEETCDLTLKLVGGDVAITGVRNVDQEGAPQQLPITGGTDDYEGESGTATIEFLTDGNVQLTLELTN